MDRKKVILVSGMSGAGKSTSIESLEDMGYHSIENFPVQMVSLLVDMLQSSNDPRYYRVALSTTAEDFPDFLRNFSGSELEMDVQVLFLDASDSVLLSRYKSTRRAHPMMLRNTANTMEEAIAVERQMFAKNRSQSFTVIDTGFLTEKQLKRKLESYFGGDGKQVFSVSFVSFGYKYGVPLDADLMIDVRFLPNPFWDISLRPYNGNDDSVYHYVMDKPETQEFMTRLLSFLDYSLEEYRMEGKNHFTVAIGCTGGQHRSVAVTNYLYDHYQKTYRCYKDHREEKHWTRDEQ